MNNAAYLGLSKLEISQIVIYNFWYDYAKREKREKTKYVTWIQIAL